jgi:hypothetical protein
MTQTTTRKPRTTTKPIELPPNPFQHEILELVSKQRSRESKIELLQKYQNDALTALLIWNFDNSVISLIPQGDVPYSAAADMTSGNDTLSAAIEKQISDKMIDAIGGNQKTTLRNEVNKFHLFILGGNDTLTAVRRETIFIQLLEGLHPKEARILCLVKDKKLSSIYKIDLDLVKEAYPFITWGGRS